MPLPTNRTSSSPTTIQEHLDDHNDALHPLFNTLEGVATLGNPLDVIQVNAGGTGVEWAAQSGSTDPYRRQGGSATDWSSSGTTTYTPTSGRIQVGARISGTMAASGFSDISVTFPVAFSQVPLVIVGQGPVANNGHVGVIAKSVTASGFTLGFNNFSASNDVTVVAHWMAIGEA